MKLKFETQPFRKHEQSGDFFIKVSSVVECDGRSALIHGSLMNQQSDSYEHLVVDVALRLTAKDYKKWHPYKPVGDCTYLHL
jgi:hypothetical protein